MQIAEKIAAIGRSVFSTELPIRIEAWDGSSAGDRSKPLLRIESRRALRRLMWSPNELGFAQAYVTGELDVPGDSAELDRAFRALWASPAARNGTRATLGPRHYRGVAALALRSGAIGPPPKPPRSQAKVTGRMHTLSRDREVIAHHYDLSNDFYALILDPTMAYSCAYYATPDLTVEKAQIAKLDLICRKLGLREGMRMLDVGCGWGSLSLHAAEYYGVQVTGVTISQQQHQHITEQIERRGLTGRVEVRVQDYREVDDGEYDAVSSIEMGEHVGLDNYPQYAAQLFRHLKPGGRLLLQQMSRHAGAAPGGGPFIEAFIAPDMHMRPLPQTLTFLERAGFEILETQNLREHYARTIADWHRTFDENYDRAVEMVGEEVARVWRLYLVGAGLSFEQGRMGVDQILMRRPTGELAEDPRAIEPQATTWYES
ncbi:methyltransferase domain-containing protein [Epidermidibacterium keratini]|uniref:Methyltransferase domain-containing protein n=1 Tax=Epidermidibacterium keratini TaxID=1891644 RepID=A0A7L4YMR8_9ACTN|nr:cyclopropane-fatty-acyl-phospholipid synthase family protein [Epidermidibacterium keratini]QHC00378.1 methyltransferase domain-containing protein [Epidermidibacterium keratini]